MTHCIGLPSRFKSIVQSAIAEQEQRGIHPLILRLNPIEPLLMLLQAILHTGIGEALMPKKFLHNPSKLLDVSLSLCHLIAIRRDCPSIRFNKLS
jgi:hypothetical protein